ncbi:MAG: D-aminoacyl-tRNA deacylase [Bacteriovoracaceae bacterium]
MKVVVQRSLESSVLVDGNIVGSINSGFVLLVCMETGDTLSNVEKAAEKLSKLRIFEDENQKMNLSIQDVKGEALIISQFTLSWDGRKGNRPSFDFSLSPDKAQELFSQFCEKMRSFCSVATGRFGADMKVSILNDGPVTFHFEF